MLYPSRHIRRFRARTFAAFLAPALLLIGCATAADDEPAPKIIAIGDLHGDFEAYENILRDAGLTNKRGRWAGGDAILVQTGDIVDRGPDSKKIIEHLQKLKKRANRKGGDVVTLVGNHEAMNMIGDLRYVHPGEYEAFKTRKSSELRDRIYELNRERIETAYLERDMTLSSEAIKAQWESKTPLGMIEHQQAWRPDGEIGTWVIGNPAIAIIGDSLFVHGGVSPKYTSFSVEEINAQVAAALAERSIADESIINDPDGPLWYRGLIERPEPSIETEAETGANGIIEAPPITPEMTIEEEVDAALAAFGVARIIVGHTPSLTGVNALYGGKVIQIDTGISGYYGGTESFLRIENGVVYAHDNGAARAIGEEARDQ